MQKWEAHQQRRFWRLVRTYLGIPLLLNVPYGEKTVFQVDLEAIDDHLVRFRDHKDRDFCVLVSSVQGHLSPALHNFSVRRIAISSCVKERKANCKRDTRLEGRQIWRLAKYSFSRLKVVEERGF